MIGSFAVGKSSLVKRYVRSIFSEEYLTTVGVKVDKKTVQVADQEVNLLLWDLHGEDEFQKLRLSYLRGMSGYLLVVDGTRRMTLERALFLQQSTESTFGPLPFVLVLNKADLTQEWELEEEKLQQLQERGWHIARTSAKTGDGVEEVFTRLAAQML